MATSRYVCAIACPHFRAAAETTSFADAGRLCAPTLKRGARLPIRAVSYEAAIDQLFKRMRSSTSPLTQQAVSTPRGPVPNERRRRRPPHGRRTETTGEWPPATRDSPQAPAEDG